MLMPHDKMSLEKVTTRTMMFTFSPDFPQAGFKFHKGRLTSKNKNMPKELKDGEALITRRYSPMKTPDRPAQVTGVSRLVLTVDKLSPNDSVKYAAILGKAVVCYANATFLPNNCGLIPEWLLKGTQAHSE